jgi:hypothetical protein
MLILRRKRLLKREEEKAILEAKKAESLPKKKISDQPPTDSKPSHVQVGDALIDHLLPL